MKNKEYYKKAFSKLTASEDVIQEVLDMDRKKVYRFTKRTAGVAAAAALTLAVTGAAYAATDGNIAQLLERITLYINGEQADIADYGITPGKDGSYTFEAGGDENPVSITLNPESGDAGSDYFYLIDYAISLDTDRLHTEEYPFTLEPENGRLILVEENGNRLDITAVAASEEGYSYIWKDADGVEQKAVISGTPEEYCISSAAKAVEADSGADAVGSASIAIEQ